MLNLKPVLFIQRQQRQFELIYKLSKAWTTLPPSTSNCKCVFTQPPPTEDERQHIKSKPSKVITYLRLMRVDKPIGVWLLYWPCTWSIAMSAPAGCLPDAQLMALFGAGALFMRSAGCIFNDLWDQEFDKKVERTKNRPLANGEVTEKEAVMLLAGLLSASLGILFQLNPLSILMGAASIWLVVAYPLAKRYTNWPQLILGATFNWGAMLGWVATTGQFTPHICLPLYFGCICWTMVYDTIYAHQDKHDDILIGVKSTALRFGEKTQTWLGLFSLGMLANLAIAGLATNQQWPFYTALAASAIHLGWQFGTLQTESSEDCWKKFHSNQWIGAAMLTGIVLGNLVKAEETSNEEVPEEKDELQEYFGKIESRDLNVNFYT